METMKNTVPYIPHELIFQILLRLLVKSLIRLKCVCKFWFSLISSNTHFANSRFQITATTHTHRVLFISPYKTRYVDLEDDTASVSPINFIPYQILYPRIEIKGSCRGFILLYYYSSLYLWNPTTRLHKQIPRGFNLDFDIVEENFYGFGYDHSTDDYLVVSISSGTNSSYLEFFSFRANAWEQIDDGTTNIHYSNATKYSNKVASGSLFNGTIHWYGYRPDLQKDVIVAFDLSKRKLLDMNLPDQFDQNRKLINCGLWVFREFFSLQAMDYDNLTIEIWVMKEYKVHSSWTKTHVFPTDVIHGNYFSPLCCTKSGDIVGIDSRTRLLKYSDEGQLLWNHLYFKHPLNRSRAVMYSESLFSFPGNNIQAYEDDTNKKNEVAKYSPFFC